MPPSFFVFRSLFWLATATMLLSCGKPPGPEGPPPGMAMPVVVAPVKREPLEERIPMVGSLEPKEDIRVLSETSARIVKISFTPGTPVAPGDVLFELDSRKQKAMLAEGKAKLALTDSELSRGEELMVHDEYLLESRQSQSTGLRRTYLERSESPATPDTATDRYHVVEFTALR